MHARLFSPLTATMILVLTAASVVSLHGQTYEESLVRNERESKLIVGRFVGLRH